MGEYAGLPSQAFWIWLQHGLGVGSVKPKRIYSFYSALQEFAEGGRKEWRLMGFLSQKEMDLLESYTPTDAARSMEYWEKRSIQVVAMADSAYPALLREIHAPPAVLYLQGRLPDFSASLNLAMVGTRNATVAGMRTARYFSRALARAGLVVVSGGARGIDSAAHLGALDAGGTTICVLGCGIGYSLSLIHI